MKKQMSTHALCAKEIRKILKKEFPNTKFSVRADSFSGGNSVNIYWTDGPTSNKVDEFVKKFQYGHFDGMTDCYEYSNGREDIPQVKFVMTTRKMSDQVRDLIVADHNSNFCEEAKINDINGWNDSYQCWNNNLVWRKFSEISF